MSKTTRGMWLETKEVEEHLAKHYGINTEDVILEEPESETNYSYIVLDKHNNENVVLVEKEVVDTVICSLGLDINECFWDFFGEGLHLWWEEESDK